MTTTPQAAEDVEARARRTQALLTEAWEELYEAEAGSSCPCDCFDYYPALRQVLRAYALANR